MSASSSSSSTEARKERLQYVVATRIPALPVRIAHIRALAGLPDGFHKGPFDRILVAQCLAEGLTLVSKDVTLSRYGLPVVW